MGNYELIQLSQALLAQELTGVSGLRPRELTSLRLVELTDNRLFPLLFLGVGARSSKTDVRSLELARFACKELHERSSLTPQAKSLLTPDNSHKVSECET